MKRELEKSVELDCGRTQLEVGRAFEGWLVMAIYITGTRISRDEVKQGWKLDDEWENWFM